MDVEGLLGHSVGVFSWFPSLQPFLIQVHLHPKKNFQTWEHNSVARSSARGQGQAMGSVLSAIPAPSPHVLLRLRPASRLSPLAAPGPLHMLSYFLKHRSHLVHSTLSHRPSLGPSQAPIQLMCPLRPVV